ncbi:MAG: D-alanine--D-alanine ligase [Candidatus Saccharibacteria bacterium]|nr:D-alanine--D-alanine ligase [Candidatus Saccharibacteria bacterium]
MYTVRMANIIVLAGGSSDERAVSLRSGVAVARALQAGNHNVQVMDPADGLDNKIARLKAADVVFPALHGVGGEDGVLQKFFEDNDICYVGSDSASSTLCFDKARYTVLLKEHGILVPDTALVNFDQYQQSALSQRPYVLKPNDGGSSIDTFIVREPHQADKQAISEAFSRHGSLLLQELVTGTEITVAVLGSLSLPVIEIIPPADQEFDYENKYNGATQELCPPVNVNEDVQAKAQALASEIHGMTGCRDMSRTDMIVDPSGELYVLETNTIPGLTDQSLLPKAAAAGGLDMSALCHRLVLTALERSRGTDSF